MNMPQVGKIYEVVDGFHKGYTILVTRIDSMCLQTIYYFTHIGCGEAEVLYWPGSSVEGVWSWQQLKPCRIYETSAGVEIAKMLYFQYKDVYGNS